MTDRRTQLLIELSIHDYVVVIVLSDVSEETIVVIVDCGFSWNLPPVDSMFLLHIFCVWRLHDTCWE